MGTEQINKAVTHSPKHGVEPINALKSRGPQCLRGRLINEIISLSNCASFIPNHKEESPVPLIEN